MKKNIFLLLLSMTCVCACTSHRRFDVDASMSYCNQQLENALSSLNDTTVMPKNIPLGGQERWNCTSIYDWTSGFWPGILWYLYEYTQDSSIKLQAERFTSYLYPVLDKRVGNHDLGFMMYCSLGNAYRLTGKEEYKNMLLRAADSLSTLFDKRVGTIHSWPGMRKQKGWPHNTIIDNMMNIELLFWASQHSDSKTYYDIAYTHALTTARNHFRDDYTTCHVVVYDTINGSRISQLTHQGYSNTSMWARGQAWAIYGFTMCYRETGNPLFLQVAQRAADVYLKRLPSDSYVPYWDFDAPSIPDEPRDASAAAVVSSALLELSTYVDKKKSETYFGSAVKMIEELSSPAYRSGDVNYSFLLHSTGHKPNGSEVDASIIYADYYYIEALIRLNKLYHHNTFVYK